jgi:hypothetical protein
MSEQVGKVEDNLAYRLREHEDSDALKAPEKLEHCGEHNFRNR